MLICCLYCIDFCIARPIRLAVGLALNIYDYDDDDDDNDSLLRHMAAQLYNIQAVTSELPLRW